MKKLFFTILLVLAGMLQVMAANSIKVQADTDYQQNKFKEAAQKYETIIKTQGEAAAIYYNLGNCYYKEKDIAKAVLNYERALLLDPGNPDIRFNLDMARSKTVDQVTPASQIFIVSWIHALANIMSERGWAKIAIASFIALLAMICLYIFGSRIIVKKAAFVGALLLLLVCIVTNALAGEQKDRLTNRTDAIVMAATIAVRSTPTDGGTELFVLHEGTKVHISDNTMKSWKEITLDDGKKGWIPTYALEQI